MKAIAELKAKVVTLATTGYCGYFRLFGYFRLLWLRLVTVATSGYCGYDSLMWLLPVTVATSG